MPGRNRMASVTTGAAATPPQQMRLAAIDVGSNSVHMIIAQADNDDAMTTLFRQKEMVGLGRNSFPAHRLSIESMERALATLGRFHEAAVQRGCEKVLAIATSAIREAENGGDFIYEARQRLGLDVKVITGKEEARLIYLAVRHALPLRSERTLIVDVGGGSVEFIVADEKRIHLMESLKLGAARMTAQFVKSDPISPADRAALRSHYKGELDDLCRRIAELRPARCVGTSGTLENIAAMCGTDEEDDGVNAGSLIERGAFDDLLARLLPTTSDQREGMPGLDDQRRDQITAGVLLVSELFDRLKLKRIGICPAALREGVVLDYLSRHLPDLQIRREIPDPRRRSVLDLARRCNWHRTHSEHVTRLLLRFFDDLQPLHKLGPAQREIVEYGGLLHDIGWHIARSAHHKHGMYLILNGDLSGFQPEEIAVVANIARYHRKSLPKKEHTEYQALAKKWRNIVDVGAALLRLADGLDRSHASVVEGLRCQIEPRRVVCRLRVRGDAELEIWGARRKREYFQQVFDRDIEFEVEA